MHCSVLWNDASVWRFIQTYTQRSLQLADCESFGFDYLYDLCSYRNHYHRIGGCEGKVFAENIRQAINAATSIRVRTQSNYYNLCWVEIAICTKETRGIRISLFAFGCKQSLRSPNHTIKPLLIQFCYAVTGAFVYYSTCFCGNIFFIRLAMQWPALIQLWRRNEDVFLKPPYAQKKRTLAFELRAVTFTVIVLSFCKYIAISTYNEDLNLF